MEDEAWKAGMQQITRCFVDHDNEFGFNLKGSEVLGEMREGGRNEV